MINRKYVKELMKLCMVPEGLTKQQVLNIMDTLTNAFPNVDPPILGFGGVLCLYGMRSSTGDVDVFIDPKFSNVLEESDIFNFIVESGSGTGRSASIYRCGVLDIHVDTDFPMKTEPYPGHKFHNMTLENIYEYKKSWNRPKDQEDIINLERYLRAKENKKKHSKIRYKELEEVCRRVILEKDDIFRITDKLHSFFPYLNQCEMGVYGALCLYGIVNDVREVLISCPKSHELFLREMYIFADEVLYIGNMRRDVIRCGALIIKFDYPENNGRDSNPTYGFIMPSLDELLRRMEGSRDTQDIRYVKMIKSILR